VVGVESNGANFNSLRSDVLLLELTSDMSFDEGGFAYSSVADEYDLELCDYFSALSMKRFYLHNVDEIYIILKQCRPLIYNRIYNPYIHRLAYYSLYTPSD